VISDNAGELGKAVDGSQLARGKILDWFHIAMNFKAARNSVFGSQALEPHERFAVETKINHVKWSVWHGKGRQSVSRIKSMDATLLAKEGYEFSTLYWNLRRLYFYIETDAGTLVNYGMRYHKGLPISSSIAESAVNLVVGHRMAKKQQIRWTDQGAHCLEQVRVAVLSEEFWLRNSPCRPRHLQQQTCRVRAERRELTSHALVHSLCGDNFISVYVTTQFDSSRRSSPTCSIRAHRKERTTVSFRRADTF
jgi:hypothetical protein